MTPRDQGLEALRAGDPARAIESFRQAVQQAPQDGHAWGGLGVAYCQAGRAAEGVGALEKAVVLVPSQASLHYNLGRALEHVQRPVEALAAYRRAVQLDAAHRQASAAVERLSASGDPGWPAAPPTPTAMVPPTPPHLPAPPPFPPDPRGGAPPPGPVGLSASPAGSAPGAGSAPPTAAVPGLNDFALPGMGAPPIPPVPAAPTAAGPPVFPWTIPGSPPLAPPGPPPSTGSFAPGSSPAVPPIAPALLSVPTKPTPGAWPASAFSGLPDSAQVGTVPPWTGANPPDPAAYGGPGPNPLPPRSGPAPDSGSPSSGTTSQFKAASGVILEVVVLGLFALKMGSRVWRASRHVGTNLSSIQPGPQVQDARLGFSVAFPAAFKNPAPRQVPGTRIGAVSVGYGASSSVGEAFVAAAEVGSGKPDGSRLIGDLREGLEKARRLQGVRSMPRAHQGRPGEEFRFTAVEDGKTRHGRVRIVADPPRVFTVGCILEKERDLNAPGVSRFLDSLSISPNFAGASSTGTLAGRFGDSPSRSPFPGAGLTARRIPRYRPRPMPEIQRPDLTPPEIHRPDYSRPGMDRPDFPQMRPGGSTIGPGSRPEPPTFPRGPSGGPPGPRFGRPGPGGPGGPNFNPGGPGGPGSPSFGPGGPVGSQGFPGS